MEKFKIGDKVVFKKEVLDKLNKTGIAKSSEGTSLTPQYYDCLLNNTSFKQNGYFVIKYVNACNYDIGLYIGKDLFKLYQEQLHTYKVGDIVRIKKREGYGDDYPFSFSDSMAELAGTLCRISKIIPNQVDNDQEYKYFNGDYSEYELEPLDPADKRDFYFCWHSSMFEPVAKPQEIQLQATSLKEGDLIPICGILGKIERGINYYLEFDHISDQEHTSCCKKLRELVPNFDKIACAYNAIRQEPCYFPEFRTIDELIQFVQAINTKYNSKQPTILKKSETYEIRFQKPKTSSIRGSVPTGRAICGRRRKTAIKRGHLSNTTCYC